METLAYRDQRGHVWNVSLTLAGGRRIDKADYEAVWSHPFSILAPDEHLFPKMAENRSLVMCMIYPLIQPQIYAHKDYQSLFEEYMALNPDELDQKVQEYWGEAQTGEVIDKACDAFWDALADFYPDQRTVILKFKDAQRNAIRMITAKMERMMTEALPLVEEEMNASSDQLMRELREKSAKRRGSISLKPVESSVGPEPSGRT
jgi:hypothetical protein